MKGFCRRMWVRASADVFKDVLDDQRNLQVLEASVELEIEANIWCVYSPDLQTTSI